MKNKIIVLSGVLLLLGSCYDMNTSIYPNLAGFHTAQSPFGADDAIQGMASDGQRVVAVGGDIIACSADEGVSWTAVTAIVDKPSGFSLNCAAWGEGYYLAGGTGGIAAWSKDGLTWYAGVIGPMNPKNINAVAAGIIKNKSVFVAAGDDGRIAYALDHPGGPWYMVDLSPFGEVDIYGEDIFGLTWSPGAMWGAIKSPAFLSQWGKTEKSPL
jgi:hypothetical protein